jgi:hypothetical protein
MKTAQIIPTFQTPVLHENSRPRSLSVSDAARALKMHRSSVHRYLVRYPALRSASGKVSLARLIQAIEADKKIEPRGRALDCRPRKGPSWRSKAPYRLHFKASNNITDDWKKQDALDFLYEFGRLEDWAQKLRAVFGI